MYKRQIYARALNELVSLGDLDPIAILTRASAEMSVGELRQLGTTDHLRFDEDDYTRLIGAKTASLMAAACEVGAVAGARRHREALRDFGFSLGMAFQIIDDVIDYTEDASTAGKPTGLDLREHKVTLPLIAALQRMPKTGRKEVDALFESECPTDEQIARVTAIVHQLGGIEYARERAGSYAERAEDSLDRLPRSSATAALARLVGYVMERHA